MTDLFGLSDEEGPLPATEDAKRVAQWAESGKAASKKRARPSRTAARKKVPASGGGGGGGKSAPPPPKKKPRVSSNANIKIRSAVRSIVKARNTAGKRVCKRIIELQDTVDTQWLSNNRLKHQVKPVVSNFINSKAAIEALVPDQTTLSASQKEALLLYLNKLVSCATQLMRTQEKLDKKLVEMSRESQLTRTEVLEFMRSTLTMGRAALKELPPYMPEKDAIISASFYQLRMCEQPIDPRKLFSRRNQQASKAMAKTAASAIPDAASATSVRQMSS